MKTHILTLAAALTLTAGAAAAQPYGQWNRSASVDQRQAMLDRRIEHGVANGQLTRREAWQARREFRDIQRIEYRYRRDGRLSRWETADLSRRLNMLAQQVRLDRRDDQRRYGYNEYRPY
jgi:hypothetical protein